MLDMFSCCESLRNMCGGLDKAVVNGVTVNRERLYMELHVTFARMPAPAEKAAVGGAFGGGAVTVTVPVRVAVAPRSSVTVSVTG